MRAPGTQPSVVISLIGYRGSGKSAVGAALAARLHCPFIDTDQRVESAAGRTIARFSPRTAKPSSGGIESAALAAALVELMRPAACPAEKPY